MRLEMKWRGNVGKDRSPRFTLTDFARRKGLEPEIMFALFQQSPDRPRPMGSCNNGLSFTSGYSLRELEAWWKARPVGLGEAARELGTTAYKLGRVIALAGVQPLMAGGGKRPKHFYSRELLLAAWAAWAARDTRDAA